MERMTNGTSGFRNSRMQSIELICHLHFVQMAGTNQPPPVALETIDYIVELFNKEVPLIFGENLAFGFICGSVARRNAHHGDDIDTVIAVHSTVSDQVSRFRNWIFELHRRTDMTVDEDFPYELFSTETMHQKFGGLASLRPSLHYVSSATYDTMTWAEMVSNPVKAGIIGDREMLNSQSQRCIDHVHRWREEIRRDLKVSAVVRYLA